MNIQIDITNEEFFKLMEENCRSQQSTIGAIDKIFPNSDISVHTNDAKRYVTYLLKSSVSGLFELAGKLEHLEKVERENKELKSELDSIKEKRKIVLDMLHDILGEMREENEREEDNGFCRTTRKR